MDFSYVEMQMATLLQFRRDAALAHSFVDATQHKRSTFFFISNHIACYTLFESADTVEEQIRDRA